MNLHSIPNPLLEQLPDYKETADVYQAIKYDPLETIDVKALSFVERSDLLSGEKVILNPTLKTIMAVMTWNGMLKIGLQNRNPLLNENRKRYFELIDPNLDFKNFKPPTSGISVNVLKGPTGTGKTITINRFCASLPIIIEHKNNQAAGWTHHRQLVYLRIDMPHDGSRSGFLKSILLKIDSILETTYAVILPRQHRGVIDLEVATIQRLVAHHTGIIFIDEAQLRNLVENGQAVAMQMFLLQLMNTGIPIVISGNERALDWLKYSQDKTRMSLTEMAHFYPIGALDEQDWEIDWELLCNDGIMKFYVLPDPIEDRAGCSKMLYECSGGIARLAITLWSLAQRHCLFYGRNSVVPSDIKRAYLSQTFKDSRPLADGFRFKSANTLAIYPDVDVDFYRVYWQSQSQDEHQLNEPSDTTPSHNKTSKVSSAHSGLSEKSKFKSEQTRQKNKQKRIQETQAGLSEDDIRKSGHIHHNLDQLAQLQNELEEK